MHETGQPAFLFGQKREGGMVVDARHHIPIRNRIISWTGGFALPFLGFFEQGKERARCHHLDIQIGMLPA
jgi:hypothetical protein